MRKRCLGRSGLTVSEVGLGTWGLSGDGYGPVDPEDQVAVIERALDLGVTLFETADCYAKGAMESLLGKHVPADDAHVIVTKVGTDLESKPRRKRFDRDFIERSLERSLERQGRERLDVVLLHNPSAAAMISGAAAKVLAQWVSDGRLRAWGVSAGGRDVVAAAMAGEHKPQLVQLAYNVFYTSPITTFEYALDEAGVGILARSVLAHGLLVGAWRRDKTFDRKDHRRERWTPEQLERRIYQLSPLRGLQTQDVKSMRAAALRWVLDNPRVGCAVLGPRSTVQLDQLLRESGRPPYLDAGAKRRVAQRLGEVGAVT